MIIDFPEHHIHHAERTPFWMFWKPKWRRLHWRWTVDHNGCRLSYYWQYSERAEWRTTRPTL